MNDYVLYNGRFFKSDAPLVGAGNRGLRYGDGLFETMRCNNGVIRLGDNHFERLFSGLATLGFDLPTHFTPDLLASEVAKLCSKNQHANARVRINVFRGNGGLYDPDNHHPQYIIESWRLPSHQFTFNENGLVTGIYTAARKSADAFAHLKSNNYLPYVMAAIHAKKERWNDAFVLNSSGHICDASIANVFIVKNGLLRTCPLSEGCVAGVMRGFLLSQLPDLGIPVEENVITVDDLLNADEIFLSNAVKGIRWVSDCDGSQYGQQVSAGIFERLLKSWV